MMMMRIEKHVAANTGCTNKDTCTWTSL